MTETETRADYNSGQKATLTFDRLQSRTVYSVKYLPKISFHQPECIQTQTSNSIFFCTNLTACADFENQSPVNGSL